jgi:putative ABC transport system permease protein
VIVTQVLEADWVLNVPLVGGIIVGAMSLFALAGAVAGFVALGRSPTSVLAAASEFG